MFQEPSPNPVSVLASMVSGPSMSCAAVTAGLRALLTNDNAMAVKATPVTTRAQMGSFDLMGYLPATVPVYGCSNRGMFDSFLFYPTGVEARDPSGRERDDPRVNHVADAEK